MNSMPTLQQVFDNKDFVAALIFIGAAGVGQFFHAVKKWAMDKNVDCMMDWFTKDKKRTVLAIFGNLGGMVVFIGTGVLGPILVQPNGWWALILFGFTNGFSADSALNKSITSDGEESKP